MSENHAIPPREFTRKEIIRSRVALYAGVLGFIAFMALITNLFGSALISQNGRALKPTMTREDYAFTPISVAESGAPSEICATLMALRALGVQDTAQEFAARMQAADGVEKDGALNPAKIPAAYPSVRIKAPITFKPADIDLRLAAGQPVLVLFKPSEDSDEKRWGVVVGASSEGYRVYDPERDRILSLSDAGGRAYAARFLFADD